MNDDLVRNRLLALASPIDDSDWPQVLRRAAQIRAEQTEERRALGRADAAGIGRPLLERLGAFRGRSRRRRVLVLVAAALVGALAVAAAVGGLRVLILDKGFIGLPPEGATPSTPESGELVLTAYGLTESSRNKMWLYADGRMIWQREGKTDIAQGANEESTGYLEQRLTREGVELLRSEVVSTGLFGHDLALRVKELSPGAALFVAGANWIHVRNDDRLVRVTWGLVGSGESDGPDIATIEQLRTLHRLIVRITEPESWLPPRAWESREIRAYVPSRFAIVLAEPAARKDPDAALAQLPPAAAELLRSKGWKRSSDDGPPPPGLPYLEVTTEEAQSLAAGLDAAGAQRESGHEVEGYRIETPDPDMPPVELWFEPIFPHGEWICSACG